MDGQDNVMPDVTTETTDTRLQEKDAAITALEEEKARLEERTVALEMQLAEFAEARAAAERVAMAERLAKRKLEFAEVAKEIAGLPENEMDFGEELMWLEDADQTDDKAHYNRLLNVLRALGNQEKTAKLFSEVGHEGNAKQTAEQRFESLVKQAMSEKGIDRGAAITLVARENRGLYAEYDKSVTKNISD